MPRMIVSCTEFSDLYYREHIEELMGFGLDMLDNVDHVNENAYATPDTRWAALNREVERDVGARPGRHLFFD